MQYKRIVSWLEHESGLSEEDEKKAKALQLAAHLNLAMCFLKIQEPKHALDNCDKVFNIFNIECSLLMCLNPDDISFYSVCVSRL